MLSSRGERSSLRWYSTVCSHCAEVSSIMAWNASSGTSMPTQESGAAAVTVAMTASQNGTRRRHAASRSPSPRSTIDLGGSALTALAAIERTLGLLGALRVPSLREQRERLLIAEERLWCSGAGELGFRQEGEMACSEVLCIHPIFSRTSPIQLPPLCILPILSRTSSIQLSPRLEHLVVCLPTGRASALALALSAASGSSPWTTARCSSAVPIRTTTAPAPEAESWGLSASPERPAGRGDAAPPRPSEGGGSLIGTGRGE
mmetsp:Transcript_13118/g.39077  ORF Transcript_13118/g.39077 Transcript_13118/m.39077 type:complete len:261 (+) Transcript_13118:550-1332(+)